MEWLLKLYHNYSFMIKFFLSFIFVIGSILLRFDFIQYRTISKFLVFDCIILLLLLLLLLWLFGTIPFIRTRYKVIFKKGPKLKLKQHDIDLANKMGVKVLYYYRVSGLDNVLNLGKNIYIGEDIEKLLTPYELTAVLAHEFSHIKNERKHCCFFVLGFILLVKLCPLILYQSSQRFPIFPLYYLIFTFINWFRELDCDNTAIEYVESKHLINALLKMSKYTDSHSFSHPSVRFRINNLRNNHYDP